MAKAIEEREPDERQLQTIIALIEPASSARSAGDFGAVGEGGDGSIPLLARKPAKAEDLIAKFTF